MKKPKIISGICEFCGVAAVHCQHYSGLVNEEGFFITPNTEPHPIKIQPPTDLVDDIYRHIFDYPMFDASEKNKVEIILIRYNLPDIEQQAIDAVNQHTKFPYKLTVYDNYQTKYPLSELWNRLIKQSD